MVKAVAFAVTWLSLALGVCFGAAWIVINVWDGSDSAAVIVPVIAVSAVLAWGAFFAGLWLVTL